MSLFEGFVLICLNAFIKSRSFEFKTMEMKNSYKLFSKSITVLCLIPLSDGIMLYVDVNSNYMHVNIVVFEIILRYVLSGHTPSSIDYRKLSRATGCDDAHLLPSTCKAEVGGLPQVQSSH